MNSASPTQSIWVFEDDPDHLELIRLYCEQAGLVIPLEVFGSSAEVESLFSRSPAPPCAAVVDSNLSGIEGLNIIRRLRATYPPELPIIFYSSTPISREQNAAARSGADRTIVKNFGVDGMPEALRELLRQ